MGGCLGLFISKRALPMRCPRVVAEQCLVVLLLSNLHGTWVRRCASAFRFVRQRLDETCVWTRHVMRGVRMMHDLSTLVDMVDVGVTLCTGTPEPVSCV